MIIDKYWYKVLREIEYAFNNTIKVLEKFLAKFYSIKQRDKIKDEITTYLYENINNDSNKKNIEKCNLELIYISSLKLLIR